MLLHWFANLYVIHHFVRSTKSYAHVVVESKGMDEFFAVLVKLRLNTPMKDLAYRLHCSEPHFSTIFHKWLYIMHHNLQQLVKWPDAETLRANLPQAFRKHYSRVKCIIDCLYGFYRMPPLLCSWSSNLLF